MPLLRHEVKNEYGLGKPELYRETPNREDPKALLDGLAVAGLVGILRQLGDLTEFAAEVFHGLQEEVMATASRSHKLMARMQSIEAALPPLEKAVLAQTSHLHFAYTSGSEWHPRIRNEKNHFIYNDLPRFVMDSYEECRDPPRLHLLDKFDIDGPGSCLKRYSDPVFFKRMSDDRKETDIGRTPKDRKSRKSKKKRSSRRREVPLNCATMSDHSGSMQYAQPIENGHASPYHTASSVDMSLKSDPDEHTYSFGLRNGLSNVECVFQLGAALQADLEYNECSSSPIDHDNISDSSLPDGEPQVTDDFPYVSSPEKIVHNLIRWDVKTEIAESESRQSDGEETPELSTADYELSKEEKKHDDAGSNRRNTVLFADETTLRSNFSISQFEERQNDNGGSACREAVLFADETTLRSSFSLSEFEERQNDDSGSARRNTVVFADETTLRSNFRVSQLEEEHKDDGGNAHQNTVPVADESTRRLNISASQVENVESEPDDYVDALNTIESESETDLDCQTKHEVGRLYSNVSKEGVEDELNGTAYVSDEVSPKSESHAGSNFSSDKGAALELPSSVLLDNVVQTQTPETAVTHSVSDHVPDTESSISTDTVDDGEAKPFAVEPSLSLYRASISPDTVDDAEVGHSVGEPSLSCSRTSTPDQPSGGRTLKAFCESQESQVEFSGGQPVAFWTNGGLLGLEPSKPPDFVVSSSARKDLTKRSENQAQAPNSQSWCGDQDGQTDKCRDSNTISHEASQENDKIMSQFSLGHGSLGNGVRGNTPPMPDSGAKLDSSFRSGDHRSEYNGIHRTRPRKEFDEQFGCKRTEESLTSSPPLEHMKISFHPLDGFEASKLSLRFPDGSHSKEGTRDLFASFQLVPEPGISLQGLGSDDDDDTFCRSSPYNSDDNPSYETESDSEQWEHGESPGRKDNELYSSLGQISSLGFASGSLHLVDVRNDVTHLESKHKNFDTENGEGSLHSGSPLDLPCLDIMNSAPNGEKMDKLNTLESCYLSPASPLPPPLPPVQWRLLKPPSDMEKDQQHATTEAHDHDESDLRPLGFTISQPSKQALNNQHSEAVAFTLKSKLQQELEQQKLNLRKEAKTPAKGNVIDEKDEFLQQIRAKSFTLRPTTASKTLLTSGPAANDKVTAILKKANAIRQVVGSDEGEGDDSWSDS